MKMPMHGTLTTAKSRRSRNIARWSRAVPRDSARCVRRIKSVSYSRSAPRSASRTGALRAAPLRDVGRGSGDADEAAALVLNRRVADLRGEGRAVAPSHVELALPGL